MPTNLKEILQRKKERAERADRPKIDWFKLDTSESAKVVFLQELDEEQADDRGPAVYLVEHNSPQDFRRRAECSFDEEAGERCFACEMNQEEPKQNWWAKTNFYVNVYVERKGDKPGEGKVQLLSRSIQTKDGGFFDDLLAWAMEENGGKVTNQTFTISKGGEKKSPWTFLPSSKKLEVPDNLELWAPDAIVNKIPYEKQKSFYLPNGDEPVNEDESPKAAAKAAAKKASDDEDW